MYTHEIIIVASVAVPIVALVTVAIWLVTKRKSSSTKLVVLRILALATLGLELAKQIWGFSVGYDKWWVPLHISSFPVYVFMLATFLKQEWKITKVFWASSATIGLILSIGVLFVPDPIIGAVSRSIVKGTARFDYYHSVIIHYSYVVFFCLILLYKPYRAKFLELSWGLGVFVLYLILVVTVVNISKENYSNFLKFSFEFLNKIRQNGSLPLFQATLFMIYVVVYILSSIVVYYILRERAKKQ